MTFSKTLALGAMTALCATAAPALEFTGASLSLDYRHNRNVDDNQLALDAAVGVSFGSGFGLQFGLKNADYNPGASGAFGSEVHGTYEIGDGATLGAFAGTEKFASRFNYLGVEGVYASGPFSVQGAVSRYSGDDETTTHVALDGTFTLIDRLDLLAGYHRSSVGSGLDYKYVGASFDVLDGLAVSAGYGQQGSATTAENVASLGVAYTFGKGTLFRPRSFTEMFPANRPD